MSTRSIGTARSSSPFKLRTLGWLALAVGEMLVVSLLFDFTSGVAPHHNPVFYVTRVARWAAIGVPLVVLLTWSERHVLAAQWAALERHSLVGRALWVNLIVFALTAAASAAFTAHAAAATSPPWHLLPLLGALVVAMALSLVRVIVPLRGLAALVWAWRSQALIAGGAALAIVLLADAALYLWGPMADATLVLSAAILALYESNVVVDHVERGIRVGEFGVLIWDTCSGLEGLALVSGFVAIYLWTFRSELSFPKAFLLFPIGLAVSWLLNGVRIAALVSIGAHISPDVAVKGFHSQAGWIAFLLVALGLMAMSRYMGFLAVAPASAQPAPAQPTAAQGRYQATVGHLLPFVALMAGSIAMSNGPTRSSGLSAEGVPDRGSALALPTPLRLVAGSTASYVDPRGLLVGVAWIATSPSTDAGEALGIWLSQIGPELAIAWLLVRGIGTIALVPIAEELAFRGFLDRRLIGRDFHLIGPTAFSWLALVVSSLLFGALHDRWLAGALAGAIFALVMLRSGRLGDAILAHATANALIFAWALAFRQWSLI